MYTGCIHSRTGPVLSMTPLMKCGSRCCNTTSPPATTCARALRENTGFCVGVRRPTQRGRVGWGDQGTWGDDRWHALHVLASAKQHEYDCWGNSCATQMSLPRRPGHRRQEETLKFDFGRFSCGVHPCHVCMCVSL